MLTKDFAHFSSVYLFSFSYIYIQSNGINAHTIADRGPRYFYKRLGLFGEQLRRRAKQAVRVQTFSRQNIENRRLRVSRCIECWWMSRAVLKFTIPVRQAIYFSFFVCIVDFYESICKCGSIHTVAAAWYIWDDGKEAKGSGYDIPTNSACSILGDRCRILKRISCPSCNAVSEMLSKSKIDETRRRKILCDEYGVCVQFVRNKVTVNDANLSGWWNAFVEYCHMLQSQSTPSEMTCFQ